MTTDYRRQIEDLWEQADLLDEGPAKIMLLEEAIRLADTHGDLDVGFSLRENLIDTSTFGGCPEKSLVAFTWCLAQYDRDPERFFGDDLLWKYKWIANSLHKFPRISLGQIEQTLADMERRFEDAGTGKRPIYRLRANLAIHRGDRELAQKMTALWEKAPRDYLSDCPACEQNCQVDFLIYCQRDEDAILAAAPILTGRLKCKEIPHSTLGELLLPLLRLGRTAEAMAYHKKGYRLVGRNRTFLTSVGQHLAFAALTDNLGRASKMLEKHLPWALETMELCRRFDFFLNTLTFLDRLTALAKKTMPLRLPKTCPVYQETGRHEVLALRQWVADEAGLLARQFDERNGTTWFAQRLANNASLQQYATPFPFKKVEEDGD